MSIWGPEALFLKEHGANDVGITEGNTSDSLAVYYMVSPFYRDEIIFLHRSYSATKLLFICIVFLSPSTININKKQTCGPFPVFSWRHFLCFTIALKVFKLVNELSSGGGLSSPKLLGVLKLLQVYPPRLTSKVSFYDHAWCINTSARQSMSVPFTCKRARSWV